ncbi:MAG TPA: metallophosphoesterase [Terracidiphilus sp.]|nr:metallophosphoesterase [Terracidiphilus sp.]
MLQPGIARPRPPAGRAQAHPRVHPLTAVSDTRFEPLPAPLGEPPYHIDLESMLPGIGNTAAKNKQIVFHTVGDTGGIKNSDYQSAVATQLKTDLQQASERDRPRFFYHLGDVVYYNGQVSDYYSQFYEPYDHYGPPIIAIPGNHDGDPVSGQTSLDGWVRYFMTPTPHIDAAICGDAPRVTLSLPNVYFTLDCPFVTIVGMYTNVPEGGSVDSVQQQWLANELASAPEDKALIVALHHPIYSFDDHHSGSPAMARALESSINDSRRVPNIFLTAHVHNYQRIERSLAGSAPTPFLVAGAGGYFHLHGMQAATGHVDPALGAKLLFHDQYHHGYVTLTVDHKQIRGVMTPLADTGSKKHKTDATPDTFTYTAKALKLKDGQTISL